MRCWPRAGSQRSGPREISRAPGLVSPCSVPFCRSVAGSPTNRALLDVSAASGNELVYAQSNGDNWWASYGGPLLTGKGGMTIDLVNLTGGNGTPELTFGTNSRVTFNLTSGPVIWHYADVLNLFDWAGVVAVSGNTLNGQPSRPQQPGHT